MDIKFLLNEPPTHSSHDPPRDSDGDAISRVPVNSSFHASPAPASIASAQSAMFSHPIPYRFRPAPPSPLPSSSSSSMRASLSHATTVPQTSPSRPDSQAAIFPPPSSGSIDLPLRQKRASYCKSPPPPTKRRLRSQSTTITNNSTGKAPQPHHPPPRTARAGPSEPRAPAMGLFRAPGARIADARGRGGEEVKGEAPFRSRARRATGLDARLGVVVVAERGDGESTTSDGETTTSDGESTTSDGESTTSDGKGKRALSLGRAHREGVVAQQQQQKYRAAGSTTTSINSSSGRAWTPTNNNNNKPPALQAGLALVSPPQPQPKEKQGQGGKSRGSAQNARKKRHLEDEKEGEEERVGEENEKVANIEGQGKRRKVSGK